MTENNNKEITNKIMRGFRKAIKKLITEKALRNEDMIISRNGKIIRIPAKDLLKK